MRIHRTTTRSGPAEWFTGQVWLDEITAGGSPPGVVAMNVRFSPGARTAWHTHPHGQVLHVTEGVGRVQSEGGPVTEMRAGDTVHIEPGVPHWHGAAPGSFMTHLAIAHGTEWGHHVSDAEYQGQTVTREHLLTGDLTADADRVEMHQITLPAGQVAGRHTHPGGVAGYVAAGLIVFQLDGQPARELRAGDAFFEPPGATVLRFDNASTNEQATFIACYPVTGDQPLIQPL
jgi:quercetin dioxygenase-like cupin family protein